MKRDTNRATADMQQIGLDTIHSQIESDKPDWPAVRILAGDLIIMQGNDLPTFYVTEDEIFGLLLKVCPITRIKITTIGRNAIGSVWRIRRHE